MALGRKGLALGVALTLIGGVCWGFSGACGQFLFSNYTVDSRWVTSVRMLCGGLILVLVGLGVNRRNMIGIWREKRDAARLVLQGVAGFMTCQYTYLTAVNHSNAGTATVLQYLGPVMIMGLVCVWMRRRPKRLEIAAIVLAVAGTFILATHGSVRSMALTPQGLVWGLLSAVTMAVYTLLPGALIRKWGSIPVTGWGILIGGVVLALITRVWQIPVALDTQGVLAMGAIILIGTVVPFVLYLKGVAMIGAVRASMLASIEPVSAAVFAWAWLGTKFVVMDLLGFLCILTTVLIVAKSE